MWPVASRILGGKYDNVVKLKNGLKMKTDLSDILGRMVIFYGPKINYFWEPQTTKLMEILIKDARQAIVAGAHIGYMAIIAKKAMRSESELHAFEPVSYLYNIAKKNFELNNELGKMYINKEALADKNGEVDITIDNLRSAIVDSGGNMRTEKVKAVTIDNYLGEKGIENLDFMLLDVEGYEARVFAGMQNILANGNPKDIIFEYSQKIKGSIDNINEYIDPLEQFGYNFYIIKDNYKLENIERDWGQMEICNLEKNIEKFKDNSYFNVLATKRSAEELEKCATVRN